MLSALRRGEAPALVSLLRLDPRFREVYADEVAVVFVRNPQ